MSESPVCVTGASGYVGAHVVRELLERGYRVRGTVRDPARADAVAHLTGLPGATERLELVKADLLDEGAFDAAVAGCETVMHVASPYVIDVADPQRDLVDPAVNGTRNVLGACKKAGVKRIVLTSSVAALTDEPESDHVLTEADWNTKSTLERNPYYYSKALAERLAWELAERDGLDLVVINPFLVIGPSLSKGLNTSPQILRDLHTRVYPGILSLAWGFVDVRDVAIAHVNAMERPEASGRHVCAGESGTMREVVEILRAGGSQGLPSLGLDHAVGNTIVKLASYLQPKGVGAYLRTNIGRVPRFDNTKIRRELGVQFRPLKDSLLDTVADLRRWGHLPAAG